MLIDKELRLLVAFHHGCSAYRLHEAPLSNYPGQPEVGQLDVKVIQRVRQQNVLGLKTQTANANI